MDRQIITNYGCLLAVDIPISSPPDETSELVGAYVDYLTSTNKFLTYSIVTSKKAGIPQMDDSKDFTFFIQIAPVKPIPEYSFTSKVKYVLEKYLFTFIKLIGGKFNLPVFYLDTPEYMAGIFDRYNGKGQYKLQLTPEAAKSPTILKGFFTDIYGMSETAADLVLEALKMEGMTFFRKPITKESADMVVNYLKENGIKATFEN